MLLDNAKTLLGITGTDKDAILSLLIEYCTDDAKAITHNEACTAENIISSMVVYRYSKLGTEGVSSEAYSGISFNYATDYPDPIYKALSHYKRVRTL